jgi:hypothetical protein
MEEKNICLSPVDFLEQSMKMSSKALKDKKFHFNNNFNFCSFNLGAKKTPYKCCNCQSLYALTNSSSNLLQPFKVENAKSSFYGYELIVRPWKGSIESLEKECYNRWLICSCLKENNIPLVVQLILPFMCNGQPYILEENVKESKEEDYVLQSCIYYDILQSKGIGIKSFTPVIASRFCNYKYKGVKVKSSFTLGLKNITLDSNTNLYDYLTPFKEVVQDKYYSLWLWLCPCPYLEEKEWTKYIDKNNNIPFTEIFL